MKKKIIGGILGVTLTMTALSFGVAGCGNKNKPSGDDRNVYTVTVENGTGGGRYYEDDIVEVTAQVPDGKEFLKWTVDGEDVSGNESYIFTVTGDTVIEAVFKDASDFAGKKAYAVTVEGGKGSGIYASGQSCTVTLPEEEQGRSFKGWATVDGEGAAGDIISTDAVYTFNVTGNVKLAPQFNDVRLDTPNDKLFYFIHPGYSSIGYELDRMGETVFDGRVEYVKIYLYDSLTATAPVCAFKFMQVEKGGAAVLSTMDESTKIELRGGPANYFDDWAGDRWPGFIRVLLGEKYDVAKSYYAATQLIAVKPQQPEAPEAREGEEEEDATVWYDSYVSPKSTTYFCENPKFVPAAKEYTVRVIDGGQETVETYKEGEYCTVVADGAPEGQHFVRWLVNGEEFTRINPYKFKVTTDVTFTADYAPYGDEEVLISVEGGKAYATADGADGAVDKLKILSGTECVLVADSAPAGQKFAYWYYLDGNKKEVVLSDKAEYTFSATQTLKVKAAFRLYYSVTVNYVDTDGNAIAGLASDTKEVFTDELSTIEANVPQGYGFVEWLDENETQLGTFWKYSYRAEGSRTLTAVLSDELVQLETPENAGSQMLRYAGGAVVEFDRQKIDGNSGNSAAENRKTVFVDGVDHVLYYVYEYQGAKKEDYVAQFKLYVKDGKFYITTMDGSLQYGVQGAGGNLYCDTNTWNSEGMHNFFKAVVGSGYNEYASYYFAAQVVGIEKSVYQSSGITAIGSSSIRKSVPEIYSVRVESGTGGGSVYGYEYTTVTANDIAGKRFTGWEVDGEIVSTERAYTFRVLGNITLTARYVDIYSVSVEGGKVNGETSVTVDVGTEVTVTPDESEFEFLYWIIDGERIYDSEYTFTVTGTTEVKAVFDVKLNITVEGGKINGATSAEISAGEEVTLIADEPSEAGTKFRYWYYENAAGEEVKLSESAEYKFVVAVDRTIKAKFDKYYTVTVVNGTVEGYEGDNGAYDLWENDEVTLTAAETEDMGFVKWTKNGADTDSAWQFSLTVTEAAEYSCVLGEKHALEAPSNNNSQMLKFSLGGPGGYNLIEVDRQKDASGKSKTAFGEGVDYIKFYMYDAGGVEVGTFKLVQTVRGANASLFTMDNSLEITVGSTPGNYYRDWIDWNLLMSFFKAAAGENYHASEGYYVAAQAIAIPHSVYKDSGISEIGPSRLRETTPAKRNVTIDGVATQYDEYTYVNLTPKAVAGKRFVKWIVDGVEHTDENLKIKVLGDITVTTVYIDLHTVTVENGKVNGSASVTVEDGTTVTVTPDDIGHDFRYWLVNGEMVETREYTFDVTEDTHIVAVYDIEVTVTVTGGTSGGQTELTVQSNDEITLTADEPEEGKGFAYWYILEDGEEVIISRETVCTYKVVTVEEAISVYVKFKDYHTVTVTGGYIGEDADLTETEVLEDGEITFTANAAPEGEDFIKWLVNGEEAFGTTCTITVTGETTVEAVFGVRLAAPDNSNNQLIKYPHFGDGRNCTEFDRGDGTLFTENVDYVLFHVYDSTKTKVLATFKMKQTVAGGQAYIMTMDENTKISIGSSPNNYYCDNQNNATYFGFWKAVLGDNYKVGETCYFAAKLIAKEGCGYYDSNLSVIGTTAITMKAV